MKHSHFAPVSASSPRGQEGEWESVSKSLESWFPFGSSSINLRPRNPTLLMWGGGLVFFFILGGSGVIQSHCWLDVGVCSCWDSSTILSLLSWNIHWTHSESLQPLYTASSDTRLAPGKGDIIDSLTADNLLTCLTEALWSVHQRMWEADRRLTSCLPVFLTYLSVYYIPVLTRLFCDRTFTKGILKKKCANSMTSDKLDFWPPPQPPLYDK